MKILIEAHPNSSQSKVEKMTDQVYGVWLKSPAREGKANEELVRVLAGYFKVSKSQVEIKAGKGAKTKLVTISG